MVTAELLVTNTTRRPDARSRATASTDPGIATPASHTTPSRSQSTTSGRSTTGDGTRGVGEASPELPACTGAEVRTVHRPALPHAPPSTTSSPRRTTCCRRRTGDALAARDEHNIVHVDVPVGGADRYERAAATLAGWIADGTLVADAAPTFTIYRMRFVDATGAERQLVGVIGGLEVVDEGAGGVLPHERTTPKASTDRLDLTRATRSNLSPVWGLSLAGGLTDLLADPAEPVGAVTVDGVTHTRRAGDRRGPHRGDHGAGRLERRADRRRPPPLRHRPGVPRRGPRRDGLTRHAGRAHAHVRRRAGGRAAERRGDPPPVHGRHVRAAAGGVGGLVRPGADRRADAGHPGGDGQRRVPGARRPRRRRADDAKGRRRSTACGPSTERGSNTPSPVRPPR